jgi:hypothetical protein
MEYWPEQDHAAEVRESLPLIMKDMKKNLQYNWNH